MSESKDNLKSGPWSIEDATTLYEHRLLGTPYEEIAELLGRTVQSCWDKIRKTDWQESGIPDRIQERIRQRKIKNFEEHNKMLADNRLDFHRQRTDLISDKLCRAVKALPDPPLVSWSPKTQREGTPEHMGVVISDLHIGHDHSLEETGGLSEYNIDIFAKRMENMQYAVTDIYQLHSHMYKIPELHIFCLGDIVDGMNAAGKWSPVYISSPIIDQVQEGVRALSDAIWYWLTVFEKVNFYGIRGNHGRCLGMRERILTPSGYKSYNEIQVGDLVGTISKNGKFEFQPVRRKVFFENEVKMTEFNHGSLKFETTLDHDMLFNGKNGDFYKIKSQDILNSSDSTSRTIPCCAENENTDYEISDDMLRLFGWIMTDGSIEKEKTLRIYACKSQKLRDKISNTLDREQISYKLRSRDRDIDSIMGVKLLTQAKEQYFDILASDKRSIIFDLLPKRKSIPAWMYALSDRQVAILLESIVEGDGSRRNPLRGQSRETVVWGEKEFLEQLAGLCISHNIPAHIREHKRNSKKYRKDGSLQCSYYLSLRQSKSITIRKKDVLISNKISNAWCVTVDNGTIAIMSNGGECFFTGNCAPSGVEKDYCNWDIVTYNQLQAEFRNCSRISFDIPKSWFKIVEIQNHNFLLCHGDDIKSKGTPVQGFLDVKNKIQATTNKNLHYGVCGHFHNASEFASHSGRVIINGSFVGADVYSIKNNLPGTRAEQKLFGIHKERGITYSYNINLDHPRNHHNDKSSPMG